jgi:flavin-dependent dehydrogenase
MIPPFTGNGMAMAFQSAELALDPLLAYARGHVGWLETCRETNHALRRRFRVRLASAGALHSFLLEPTRQRWLGAFNRAHLLPLRPLYSVLH